MSIQRTRTEKRADIARALATAGFEDVYVLDRESAEQVLTAKRTELLDRLREEDAESVRDLARTLDRDKGSVSRDLDTLARHDLVTFRERGTRKIPTVKHETVIVEPLV
jgi:predicted transcriptional regulator